MTEGDADVDVSAEHHLTPRRCCVTSHKPAASGARLQIEQFTVPVGVSQGSSIMMSYYTVLEEVHACVCLVDHALKICIS